MESRGPLYANIGPPFLQNTSVRPTRHQEEEIIQHYKNKHATNQTKSKTSNYNVNLPSLSIRPTSQNINQGANLSVITPGIVKNNIRLAGRPTRHQEEEIIQHKNNHATNQTKIKTTNRNVNLPSLSIRPTSQNINHVANLSVNNPLRKQSIARMICRKNNPPHG